MNQDRKDALLATIAIVGLLGIISLFIWLLSQPLPIYTGTVNLKQVVISSDESTNGNFFLVVGNFNQTTERGYMAYVETSKGYKLLETPTSITFIKEGCDVPYAEVTSDYTGYNNIDELLINYNKEYYSEVDSITYCIPEGSMVDTYEVDLGGVK